MLHGIQISNRKAKDETAVDLLVGCHDRIRNFTLIVNKLAHAEGSSPQEISTASQSAYRYFSISLPLHEADEEESLRPRLSQLGDAKVSAALDAMTHQHHAIDDLIERLLPLLTLLSSNPSKLPELHAELCSIAKGLTEMFQGHLDLEENVLFPAILSRLSEQQQLALLHEMKGRRNPK